MERIEFEILTNDLLESSLNDLILMDKQAFGIEAWGKENFRYHLPYKYELSFVVKNDEKVIAFCINSKKVLFPLILLIIYIIIIQILC